MNMAEYTSILSYNAAYKKGLEKVAMVLLKRASGADRLSIGAAMRAPIVLKGASRAAK